MVVCREIQRRVDKEERRETSKRMGGILYLATMVPTQEKNKGFARGGVAKACKIIVVYAKQKKKDLQVTTWSCECKE